MQLSEAALLMETNLHGANDAIRMGWKLLAITSASHPAQPACLQTVYILGVQANPLDRPEVAVGLPPSAEAVEATRGAR